MTAARWIVAGMLTGLAGCSSAPPGYVGRFGFEAPDARTDPFGAATTLPLVVVPAAAGPILTTRQTAYANGVSQDILLGGARATAGENRIEVRIADTAAAGASGDQLTIAAPAAETIDDDLTRLFPGVEMHVSPDVISGDGRGGFSYASGSLGTTNCVYAWRYTAATRPLTLFEGASGAGKGTSSVSVRLCRALPMSALLDVVQQMASGSAGGVDPILGGAANPVFSHRMLADPSVDQPVRRSHARRVRRETYARPRLRPREAPEDRAAGDTAGTRIPLPGEVVAAPPSIERGPVVPRDSKPASDLPMPRS